MDLPEDSGQAENAAPRVAVDVRSGGNTKLGERGLFKRGDGCRVAALGRVAAKLE